MIPRIGCRNPRPCATQLGHNKCPFNPYCKTTFSVSVGCYLKKKNHRWAVYKEQKSIVLSSVAIKVSNSRFAVQCVLHKWHFLTVSSCSSKDGRGKKGLRCSLNSVVPFTQLSPHDFNTSNLHLLMLYRVIGLVLAYVFMGRP